MTKKLRIGLLGCGTVGGGFVSLLAANREAIIHRHGLDIEIDKILIRDRKRKRSGVPSHLLTHRPAEVIENGCDVIVELLGGVDPASGFIRRAIERRRPVVTANKLLIATEGVELTAAAERSGVALNYEAAVCAGVPVVRALQSDLAGDDIRSIRGVVNGTCNYVLTTMEKGLGFDAAIKSAQVAGFAEADPSLDIDGHDSLQKLMILSRLAFGEVSETTVRVEGIRDVTLRDVRRVARLKRSIRLVARAHFDGVRLDLSVAPSELERSDALGSLQGARNAVIVDSAARGELLFAGEGAGALPTASAVLADVISVGRG